MRRLGRTIRVGLLIYLVTLATVVAVEFLWPRDTLPDTAEAIVCLGGGASQDTLALESMARVERCIALYQAGIAPNLHFTGTIAAPLMAQIAQDAGVPGSAISVEETSRSTLQNALFTSRMVARDTDIVVVTTAYHLPRSWVAFRVMGYSDVSLSAAGEPSTRHRPVVREALAIWFNAGRVAMWWATPWLDLDVRERLLI